MCVCVCVLECIMSHEASSFERDIYIRERAGRKISRKAFLIGFNRHDGTHVSRAGRGNKRHVPFCRISRCSHRMSPMKAGARARKDSFPMAQICFPVMCCHGCIATPSSENSPIAQCNQWATAASDHCLGSEREKENSWVGGGDSEKK